MAFPCLSTCLSELFFIDLDQCFPGEDQMRQEIAGGNLNRICRTVTYCYFVTVFIVYPQKQSMDRNVLNLSRQLLLIEVGGHLNTLNTKFWGFFLQLKKN